MNFGKVFKDNDEFVDELTKDIKILRAMGTKYIRAFPALSVVLSVLSYILIKTKVEMMDKLSGMCWAFLPEIKEEARERMRQGIDDMLDSLNIENPEYFKSNNEGGLDEKNRDS